MKKLFYLLLLMPLSLFTSCDNDELAPYDMTITLSGVTQYDGTFYTVAGNDVSINSLVANPTGGKDTELVNVAFFIDGVDLSEYIWNNNETYTFSTENLVPGPNVIRVTGNVLQIDSSAQNFVANYTLMVVESPEDLPEGAPEIGTYSQSITF